MLSPEFAMIIPTAAGDCLVSVGDWIIKNALGEFRVCKPDVFQATYEPAQ